MLLKVDLADTNLVVEKHVIVHDLACQDQVVDTLRVRDLPGEGLVIVRVKIVRFLGGFFVTVILVENHILKRWTIVSLNKEAFMVGDCGYSHLVPIQT